MIAITSPMEKRPKQHKTGGKRFLHLLICFVFLFCLSECFGVTANAQTITIDGCDCFNAELVYSKDNNTSHKVTCDACGTWWLENHSYSSICDTVCNICSYVRSDAHAKTYTYVNSITCMGTCSLCGLENATGHKWVITTVEATDRVAEQRIKICEQCEYVDTTYVGSPTGNPFIGRPSGVFSEVDSSSMNAYTWDVFKTIRSICIPLGIISLANCGYKVLGSIFFGTYISASDIAKIKKQFIWTIIAIMFLLLLPSIFGTAISFFKGSAWTP